jgi:hypothetical protein
MNQKIFNRKTAILCIRNLNEPLPLRCGYFLVTLGLALFGLAPTVQAACMEGCSGANTFLGEDALLNNTSGFNNTAIGIVALKKNTDGIANTATGASTLVFNTTGDRNTATGVDALFSNISGSDNTATGIDALFSNSIGQRNTATGGGALLYNTAGNYNTATGVDALLENTTGNRNTADGYLALFHNTTGTRNTADGNRALFNNATGNSNIALGDGAGENLTIGDHNIDIGNQGVVAEANTIRIGTVGTHTATFIAGISGATVPTGVAVIVDGSGHLGTATSSARFKDAIKPMDKASEAIHALKPVTFHYKQEIDPNGIPQFGLVAEQVEKVNPDLVARNEQGKAYTVRYEAVNAMLLNEFLKEHRKVEGLQKQIDALTAQLKQQAVLIQKVSAQVETSNPAPRVVANKP